MNSYIKSEFYRLLRNKWTYLFIGICSSLLVSSNIVLAAVKSTEASFPYATTGFSLSNFYTSQAMVFLLCVTVASLVFGGEYTNHTMKNSISYGISRGHIYFGKLIVEIIYAVIAFLIITGFHVATAYLLLENSGPKELELLLRTCFVSLPLLLFALAATNCFVFIIDSTGAAITAIMGLLLALPMVSSLLGMKFDLFQKLANVLPWNMLNNISFDYEAHQLILPWSGNTGYCNYWLSGSIQMVLIAFIGYSVFRGKEIK